MKICFIVGYPLNNPRSVSIWRDFFKKKKIKASMNPIELKTEKIKKFIQKIKKNKNFLAAAVTMPLKTKLFQYVVPGDLVARKSKSINLIIKNEGKLYGYNTDILALLNFIKKDNLKNILIIGLGGVGNALFNYLSLNKKIKVKAISRKKNKNKNIYNNFNKIDFKKKITIVNCTPLGSNLKNIFLNRSPIPEKFFGAIHKDSFIFDIIYKPKKTKLLRLCKKYQLKSINGLRMNSLQAKIALKKIQKVIRLKK
jgi:shikimate dehydrogenase